MISYSFRVLSIRYCDFPIIKLIIFPALSFRKISSVRISNYMLWKINWQLPDNFWWLLVRLNGRRLSPHRVVPLSLKPIQIPNIVKLTRHSSVEALDWVVPYMYYYGSMHPMTGKESGGEYIFTIEKILQKKAKKRSLLSKVDFEKKWSLDREHKNLR